MGDKSAIEWTDATWNPISGCSKVSPGCAYCYAERVSTRFGRTSLPWVPANAEANVVLHPDRLDQPLRWRRPRRIFVNSMSDLFHERVSDEFIERVFGVMALAAHHTFQVLTKRPERMLAFTRRGVYNGHFPGTAPLPNVWLGVSAENQRWADERIPLLLATPAAVRFVSAEPLLGPLDLSRYLTPEPRPRSFDLFGATPERAAEIRAIYRRVGPKLIDWVIVGGESGGPLDRRLIRSSDRDLGWVRSIRDQCQAAGVSFLFKQWGGRTPKEQGRELDGRTWDQYPTAAAAVPA